MCAALLTCTIAHADKVHLRGGSVIEGKASESGGKIVVELEAGTIRLDASTVLRVEKASTPLEEIDARRAALRSDDVVARLALADRCREEQLPKRERELLREILALAPDHAEARQRLGYVRGERGWELRAPAAEPVGVDRQRAAREAAELRQAELARDAAALAKQEAELSLSRQRLLLRAAQEDALNPQPGYVVPWRAVGPWRAAPWFPHAEPRASTLTDPPPPGSAPFAINGVRDPAQPGFSLPGVRDPASYFPAGQAR